MIIMLYVGTVDVDNSPSLTPVLLSASVSLTFIYLFLKIPCICPLGPFGLALFDYTVFLLIFSLDDLCISDSTSSIEVLYCCLFLPSVPLIFLFIYLDTLMLDACMLS